MQNNDPTEKDHNNISVLSNQIQNQTKINRVIKINRLFLLSVILPTVFAVIYYGFLASDVYISESRFIIRSPQRQAVSGLGAVLQGVGFSRSQDDTYTIQDYIQSRDALKELDNKMAISALYGKSGIDRISRFAGLYWDSSFEALLHYYQKNIVTIKHDTASSIITLQIRSFTPNTAFKINQNLLELSEELVNKLNDRGKQDMLRFAINEVSTAENKAKNASLALSRYRKRKNVFDPEKQSAIHLQQISKLQEELVAYKTQLAQIRATARNNPQISALQVRIDVLNTVIADETAKVTGDGLSLADAASEYESLTLDKTFTEKQLSASLVTLEQAHNEALRKQLYLERIVQPNSPDKATEPKRIKSIIATFMLGLITFGVLSLLIAAIKEHRE